ncbi:uncharacterized protein ATNIH1004_010647 [Aspergillus tanneri]|uniref:Uncharacterized protein n=1 Tax=Aspergillus tanneri TaxID=1220188 RepID=A0A5M9MA18_9EURO|nr:uncharacterized protein ATNIH1004_010647 [Aspergillus tanneri]KAA8643872.1 hypothetical protein ATNIH1004_010647 [Aspergillus tanneri]
MYSSPALNANFASINPTAPSNDPLSQTFNMEPPFELSDADKEVLNTAEEDFIPHTWEEIKAVIGCWRRHVSLKTVPDRPPQLHTLTREIRAKFGSATNFIVQNRLQWKPESNESSTFFPYRNSTPFADQSDYRILRNDWPYGMTPGMVHLVIWSKTPIGVDEDGDPTPESRQLITEFITRTFAAQMRQKKHSGDNIQWFKNRAKWQSVRALEHIHVVLRDVDEDFVTALTGQHPNDINCKAYTPSMDGCSEELVNSYPSSLQLQLVQVFFRHGERAPIKNVFSPITNWEGCSLSGQFRELVNTVLKPGETPSFRAEIKFGGGKAHECAPGDLTDIGVQSTNHLGRDIRQLYVDHLQFLPERLTGSEVLHLRSTRQWTLSPERRDVRLETLPIVIRLPEEETLLPNEDFCPRLRHLLGEFLARTAKKVGGGGMEPVPELSKLNNLAPAAMGLKKGIYLDSQPNIADLRDSIAAAMAAPSVRASVPPPFRDQDIRLTLQRIAAEQEHIGFADSAEVCRLGVGPLLTEIVDRMAMKVGESCREEAVHKAHNNSHPRIALFGCHDTTIGMILTSLGIMRAPAWHWPPFTSSLTVELFKSCEACQGGAIDKDREISDGDQQGMSRKQKQPHSLFFVRLHYNGRSIRVPACKQPGKHLAGNEEFCTLVSDIPSHLPQELYNSLEIRLTGVII